MCVYVRSKFLPSVSQWPGSATTYQKANLNPHNTILQQHLNQEHRSKQPSSQRQRPFAAASTSAFRFR